MKMEFHHIGIPTKKKRANETYMAGAKLYVTDVADSEHKIEWLRFEEGSPLPKILQTTAHAAFKVDERNRSFSRYLKVAKAQWMCYLI